MSLHRALLAAVVTAACTTHDPLFCDQDHPCTDPARPYCDLQGIYPGSEGHGKSCVPNPFDSAPPPPDAGGPDGSGAMHTLTVTPTGSGTGAVTSMPAGIDCGTTCTATFPDQTSVTLTATPTPADTTFVGWTGACTGTGACAVVMDGAKTVGARFNHFGDHLWSKVFGGDASVTPPPSVASDANGNILTAGSFSGSGSFAGMPLASDGGSVDGYVAKLSPEGSNLLWIRQLGGSGSAGPRDVAVSSGGDVLVIGTFEGALTCGSLTAMTTGAMDSNIFVAKLNSADGTCAWLKPLGDSADQRGLAVAVTPADDVVVTGVFRGGIDFGGGENIVVIGSYYGIYLASYRLSGAYRWVDTHVPTMNPGTAPMVVAADATGVTWAGAFGGDVNLGGSQLTGSGLFLARFTDTGTHVWSRKYDNGGVWSLALALDPVSHDILLAGGFRSGAVFGPYTLSAGAFGIGNSFLARFSGASGDPTWAKGFSPGVGNVAYDVAIDPRGSATMTGSYQGSADFEGPNVLPAVGGTDLYVAAYDVVTGAHRWSKGFGSTSDGDVGSSIAAAPWGDVTVVGQMAGAVDLGGGPVGPGAFIAQFNR